MSEAPRPTQRLDKWLWHARLCKTRGLAAEIVAGGKVRVNGRPVRKPATAVGAGDTLTVVLAGRVRVLRVTGLPERRGPAPEAQAHYTDLDADPGASIKSDSSA